MVTTSNVVTEAYDTDAYGNTLCYSGPGTDGHWFTNDDVRTNNPINTTIFTGRQYDPESQIYYYRARYYSSGIGRFISRDPIGMQGGINLYAYVLNNPIISSDPTGHTCTEIPGSRKPNGNWQIYAIGWNGQPSTVQETVILSITVKYTISAKTHCCCQQGTESAFGTLVITKTVDTGNFAAMQGTSVGALPNTGPLALISKSITGASITVLSTAATTAGAMPTLVIPNNKDDVNNSLILAKQNMPVAGDIGQASWMSDPCAALGD